MCGRILQFPLLLCQCSDIKEHSEKPFQNSSDNNCDGVLFQWSCKLWGNWRKEFIIVSFCEFLWNFSNQLFSKTASCESFWKTLWDFTSVLSGRSHSICASKFWHLLFGLHSNSWGADEIRHLPILIDFCNRNMELLLLFSICPCHCATLPQNNYLANQTNIAVLWNSCPEKKLEHILENVRGAVSLDRVTW